MNLYELNNQIKTIEEMMVDFASEHEGDITDFPFEIELDGLEMDKQEKITSLGIWHKNLNAEALAIKTEKDSLAKRQKALEGKASRIKEYITAFLGEGNKVNEPQIVMSWRKSKSVELKVSAEELPEQFQKITIKEDKSALKADILANGQDGEAWEFATIKENQNLQIK